jgi:hypothetical protein
VRCSQVQSRRSGALFFGSLKLTTTPVTLHWEAVAGDGRQPVPAVIACRWDAVPMAAKLVRGSRIMNSMRYLTT